MIQVVYKNSFTTFITILLFACIVLIHKGTNLQCAHYTVLTHKGTHLWYAYYTVLIHKGTHLWYAHYTVLTHKGGMPITQF